MRPYDFVYGYFGGAAVGIAIASTGNFTEAEQAAVAGICGIITLAVLLYVAARDTDEQSQEVEAA